MIHSLVSFASLAGNLTHPRSVWRALTSGPCCLEQGCWEISCAVWTHPLMCVQWLSAFNSSPPYNKWYAWGVSQFSQRCESHHPLYLFKIFSSFSNFYLFHTCVGRGKSLLYCTCGGQRATCRGRFLTSTMWVLGVKQTHLVSMVTTHSLSHLPGLNILFVTKVYWVFKDLQNYATHDWCFFAHLCSYELPLPPP